MRLDKYLANMKIGTRLQVKEILKQGRVTVNGVVEKSPKRQVSTQDTVCFAGQLVTFKQYHYFLLNKPKGVLTATEDLHQKTVLDLMDEKDRFRNLSPVGRLDKDTTGLLLITNDGQLNHQLLSPKHHVDKVYEAVIDGLVTAQEVQILGTGIELKDGTKFLPAQIQILKTNPQKQESFVRITIQEGKFHEIKRMFLYLGMSVLALNRVSMGSLKLDASLLPGQYRPLTDEEIDLLRSHSLTNH